MNVNVVYNDSREHQAGGRQPISPSNIQTDSNIENSAAQPILPVVDPPHPTVIDPLGDYGSRASGGLPFQERNTGMQKDLTIGELTFCLPCMSYAVL